MKSFKGLIDRHPEIESNVIEDEKHIVRTVIWPFNIVAISSFALVDWWVVPHLALDYLYLRILLVAVLVAGYHQVHKPRSLLAVNLLTLALIAANSICLSTMVAMGDEVTNLYFLGPLTLTVGLSPFSWLSFRYSLLSFLFVFVPYLFIVSFSHIDSIPTVDYWVIIIDFLVFGSLALFINYLLVQSRIKTYELLIKLRREMLVGFKQLEYTQKIVHDLKSPLSVLKLTSDALPDKQKALASQSLERTSLLIEDVLAGESDRGKNFSSGDLFENVKALVDYKKNSYERIILVLDDRYPETRMNGDLKQVVRVIDNLLENAIFASKENTDEFVEVSIGRVEKKVEVRIADSGTAFTEYDFEKATSAKGFTTKEDGHGLGLFLSNKYLKSIGSGLRLEIGDMKCVKFELVESS